jgi:hypothetical protein
MTRGPAVLRSTADVIIGATSEAPRHRDPNYTIRAAQRPAEGDVHHHPATALVGPYPAKADRRTDHKIAMVDHVLVVPAGVRSGLFRYAYSVQKFG